MLCIGQGKYVALADLDIRRRLHAQHIERQRLSVDGGDAGAVERKCAGEEAESAACVADLRSGREIRGNVRSERLMIVAVFGGILLKADRIRCPDQHHSTSCGRI